MRFYTEIHYQIVPTGRQSWVSHIFVVLYALRNIDLDVGSTLMRREAQDLGTTSRHIFQPDPDAHPLIFLGLLVPRVHACAKHLEYAIEIKRSVLESATIDVDLYARIVILLPLCRIAQDPIGFFDLLELLGISTFVGMMPRGRPTISSLDIFSGG